MKASTKFYRPGDKPAAEDYTYILHWVAYAKKLEAEVKHLTAWRKGETLRPTSCKCTLAQRLVGDGCDICNPREALEMAEEFINELEADNARLRNLLNRAYLFMKDQDQARHIVAAIEQEQKK